VCIQVNEAISKAYLDKYPDLVYRQVVVENGFDLDSIPRERAPYNGGPISFGILGTANRRWPLHAVMQGWDAIRMDLPLGSRFVLAGYLGYFAHSHKELSDILLGEEHWFEYIGPIEKDKVAEFYREVDVIVLPVPGGSMVSSSKVYEAAAQGLPVVCVQEAGGGARYELLDQPLAFFAEPRANEVADAMRNAVRALKSPPAGAARSVAEWRAHHERTYKLAALVEAVARTTQGLELQS
jgi:glycosyltransferase involved in cell wall biosynthesis